MSCKERKHKQHHLITLLDSGLTLHTFINWEDKTVEQGVGDDGPMDIRIEAEDSIMPLAEVLNVFYRAMKDPDFNAKEAQLRREIARNQSALHQKGG